MVSEQAKRKANELVDSVAYRSNVAEFVQEVSDKVSAALDPDGLSGTALRELKALILPDDEPDPVDKFAKWLGIQTGEVFQEQAARFGLKIIRKDQ